MVRMYMGYDIYRYVMPKFNDGSYHTLPGACYVPTMKMVEMFYTENGLRIFDTRPLIRRVFTEAAEGKEKGEIAEGFMDTLIRAALSQCVALNVEKYSVVLSGGVFLNRYLLSGMTRALENAGFRVYTHHRVSPSDEGICLGQIAVGAAAREALKSREI